MLLFCIVLILEMYFNVFNVFLLLNWNKDILVLVFEFVWGVGWLVVVECVGFGDDDCVLVENMFFLIN